MNSDNKFSEEVSNNGINRRKVLRSAGTGFFFQEFMSIETLMRW